jgi:hypothetical protein
VKLCVLKIVETRRSLKEAETNEPCCHSIVVRFGTVQYEHWHFGSWLEAILFCRHPTPRVCLLYFPSITIHNFRKDGYYLEDCSKDQKGCQAWGLIKSEKYHPFQKHEATGANFLTCQIQKWHGGKTTRQKSDQNMLFTRSYTKRVSDQNPSLMNENANLQGDIWRKLEVDQLLRRTSLRSKQSQQTLKTRVASPGASHSLHCMPHSPLRYRFTPQGGRLTPQRSNQRLE